ncbi:Lsr2 family protein [Psychromicrobium sp. YIM B11713]|uniref:histone-like nucleoid-structuring protein Lsr2 n=1 Tax=Psychromicrobium sp. YIM B11713 TaxID=3145233 RepID=UPI00374EFDC6
MAQKRVVELIDDLTGKATTDGQTVRFGFDGVEYEIDLSPKNAKKLTDTLAPYLEKARRVRQGRRKGSSTSSSSSSSNDKERLQEIRLWAQQNGHQVANRGRIKAEIIQAFEQAKN